MGDRTHSCLRGTLLGAWFTTAITILTSTACQTEGVPAPEQDDADDVQDDVVQPEPCDPVVDPSCELACADDVPCPERFHCEESVCRSECRQDLDCGEGRCSQDGHCREEQSEIVVDPIDTNPQPVEMDPPTCVEGQVEFEAVLPQVWLLLDRSGSMDSGLDGVRRWDALGAVLLGDPGDSADKGVVGDFQDRAAFGATFYTTGSLDGRCILDLESVALAANSYTAIRQRYEQLQPTGGTPTADSVAAVVAQAATSDLTGGPKILVLATDGEPGGCSERPGAPTDEVEAEVDRAFSKGIQTFAISISTGTNAVHMQRVANLGVGLDADADPPAPYYTAESQEELKEAFSSIIQEVPRSCVFSLNGEVDEENAGEGSVILAGEELVHEDPDGWTLKQADQVELLGTACDSIMAGEEDLDITFPCSVFTPVVR